MAITTVYAFAVYTSLENANSGAEKCTGPSPPYKTQGTSPALRSALVEVLPTLSLLDPLIVIDFILNIIYIIKFELIDLLLWTLSITSANKSAQDNTFILE